MRGWRNSIARYGEEAPEQLLAHPRNFRIHPKNQQQALEGALNDLGWLAPVVVNETTQHVIDGHLRIELAISRGEKSVPVAYVNLSEAEEVEALLTFDPIGAMAATDKANLDALLRDVATGEAAVQAMLSELAKDAGLDYGKEPKEAPEPQTDRAAELQAKWQTQRGQVWSVGRHRLMCGDSTSAEDVARLFGGGDKPAITVTDPPYGVEYDAGWRDEAAAKGLIAHAARRVGEVANDDRIDWSDAWRLCPGGVIYCWHAGRHASTVQGSLETAGFEMRCQIIWAKSRFVISRGHYHWQHEPCWYAVKKGQQAHWAGDRSQTTLWEIALDKNVEGGHSTQKPVECMARPIRNHEGDVYDPFLGSGTTIVAAEQLGRAGFGMEINPGYLAASLERLAGMGLSPVLA